MSSEDVHHAVIALFEDISRQEVVYPPNAPHSNVGELLPTGISAFIGAVRQIGAITAGDVFTDIGSGVGNVVAQFVLSTAVRASVSIEIRRDLVDRCNATLVENVMQWPNLQKVKVYAEDAKKVAFNGVPIL
ncbi:hypothetical protein PC110_g18946 [Phytophthora cactorum]|uniref:DOT1 domain-containing protein n=1 Tax=Phytophthora cactorum TaxID=29920 RepID=A0A329RJ43_9STRA|nr:hypothetical protein PC110_g18946 [Phytophthora cactorum]